MIALGLTLSLSVIYLLPRFNTPLYRAELSAGPLAARQESPWLRLADGLVLLAARPEAAAIAADRPLAVDLFWTVTGPPVGDYLTTLLLLDDEGRPWSDKSSDRPGAFRAPHPTYTWRPGVYAVDSHLVQPLPGTPPGVYRLHLIVFDRLTLWPLAAETSPGAAGPLYLGDVIIERPRRPPSPESLTRQYETDVAWGPLRLLGYDLDRAEARPGDPFLLTTYWQATAAIPEPVTAVLTLRADGGQVAFSQELPPVRADFPTTQWRPGDTWRGQHSFRLPAALAGGLYQWQLQICPAAAACRPDDPLAELSGLRLDAPLRLWQAPPPQLALAATFGDMISLLGVDWEPAPAASGVAGRIRLAWRAERDMVVSYRVFVHLLAEGGQIVAQSDGEPGQWQRPTTGWLPGEIVLDEHLLIPTAAEPAPVYTLAVGLYDAASGLRLALPDGGTAVTIDIQTIPGATP